MTLSERYENETGKRPYEYGGIPKREYVEWLEQLHESELVKTAPNLDPVINQLGRLERKNDKIINLLLSLGAKLEKPKNAELMEMDGEEFVDRYFARGYGIPTDVFKAMKTQRPGNYRWKVSDLYISGNKLRRVGVERFQKLRSAIDEIRQIHNKRAKLSEKLRPNKK